MAQMFVPQLLGRPQISLLGAPMVQLLGRVPQMPQLLGRFGADEVFTPVMRSDALPDQRATTYKVSDAIVTPNTPATTATRQCPVCPTPVQKKSWPWMLFIGLGSAAVAAGVTAAAIGSR